MGRVLRFRGLVPGAVYELTDLDTGKVQVLPGEGLADPGFEVQVPGKPGSALVRYKKVR